MSKIDLDGWSFEVQIDGMPGTKQKFVTGDRVTLASETLGDWRNTTLLIGQCEWCGKHATGDPKSTPFLCEDCITYPDRVPAILCSQCGQRLTEVVGVSRRWFRCAPCKRELGR